VSLVVSLKKEVEKMTIIKIVIVVVLIIVVIWAITTFTRKDKPAVQMEKTKSPPVKAAKVFTLAAPRNVKVDVEDSNVSISWSEVEGAKSYILYYANEENFTRETARSFAGIDGTEFQISKIPAGQYYVAVSSIDGANESALSEIKKLDVTLCKLPDPPANIRFKTLSSSPLKVNVIWDPESTLDGYVLHVNHTTPPRANGADFMTKMVDDPKTPNIILADLDPKLKWFVVVCSVLSHCGEGLPSAPLPLN
jgi:hypothetical protein